MSYRFAVDRENHEDFASGRVLYNQHGTTAFPVRLGSEIFLRSKSFLKQKGSDGPYSVYDPCCGGAYLLTTIGFLHTPDLYRIVASDIDDRAVELSKRNLSLLTTEGLNNRIAQIEELFGQHKKESHQQALESAVRLKGLLQKEAASLETHSFQADITDNRFALSDMKMDLVITDVPYGNIVSWNTAHGDPVDGLLTNILPLLKPVSMLAMISDKRQKIEHPSYRRLEQLKIGKRKITFLERLYTME